MVIAIPSFLKRLRGGTAVAGRSDGRFDRLLASRTITRFGTGRAVFVLVLEDPADGVRRRFTSSSQAESPSISEPIGDQR